MALGERFQTVREGWIAAVVTVLEMREAASPRPERADGGWRLERLGAPDPQAYRDLYSRVGAPHLWYSRLIMDEATLAGTLADPKVHVHALMIDGAAEGLLELDFRQQGACEIVYFGVTPGLVGSGAARVMMNHAIAAAFAQGVSRLWLHTNTLDHPRALDFYIRSGFRPVERRIELAPDPRLSGLLPRESAPHVPIL
ncbi:GNAT family N-acetyltransferase [Aureimonas mangrovi]|uniref:GNAT family N-acetyltransferase n=1 Tax=Aureimonas mangrovi TaxID=2758041 RepID=UPI00163D4D12|nr:GNAT family N-acetyltransferase [Aureimonas mangrovi]